jgi:hypothetical protein
MGGSLLHLRRLPGPIRVRFDRIIRSLERGAIRVDALEKNCKKP